MRDHEAPHCGYPTARRFAATGFPTTSCPWQRAHCTLYCRQPSYSWADTRWTRSCAPTAPQGASITAMTIDPMYLRIVSSSLIHAETPSCGARRRPIDQNRTRRCADRLVGYASSCPAASEAGGHCLAGFPMARRVGAETVVLCDTCHSTGRPNSTHWSNACCAAYHGVATIRCGLTE